MPEELLKINLKCFRSPGNWFELLYCMKSYFMANLELLKIYPIWIWISWNLTALKYAASCSRGFCGPMYQVASSPLSSFFFVQNGSSGLNNRGLGTSVKMQIWMRSICHSLTTPPFIHNWKKENPSPSEILRTHAQNGTLCFITSANRISQF